jgi:hypothetical protein
MSNPVQSFRNAVTLVRGPPSNNQAKLKAKKLRVTDEQASEDVQNEFVQPDDTGALNENLFTDTHSLLLAQSDTVVVSDATAPSISSTAASGAATAPVIAAPAAMVTGLSGTTLIFGGLGVLGLAAVAGSGGSTSTPIKDTTAPVFTAGTTAMASVAENTVATTVVHTASAADNVAVSAYALADGGADNDKFNLDTASGELRFKTSPNFEALASAAGSNAYTVKVKAYDAAGNSTVQTLAVTVTNASETPVFNTVPTAQTVNQDSDLAITGLQMAADVDPGASISVRLSVVHGTIRVAESPRVVQSGTGTYDNITLTGTLADVNVALAAPGTVVYRGHLAYVGADTLQMQATDGGNPALTDTDSVTITVSPFSLTRAQTFDLWQEAELAWLGDTSKNINALNQYASVITAARDATSADGSANQLEPTRRLTQYINQVTGTDIVSDAEFDAGFTITGKATAGAQATIQWRLDKDRTTGADGEGTQVLSLGANDVDNADGDNNHATGTDVTASYNNATGDWSLAFAAGNGALLQATHNTYGSGVHQLQVDTDGNGSRTGSDAAAEASRMFLVASGTAGVASTDQAGSAVGNTAVAGNFSVQDKLTSDVFVYYYGDPDGVGVGVWTDLDDGDSASDGFAVPTDKDGNLYVFEEDADYFNTPNINAATTPATASNTAMHLVTNVAAQTWEFHMSKADSMYVDPNDHTDFGFSNSSRHASLAEAMALYAANFGGNNGEGSTVGTMQPMSNAGSTNASNPAESNRPLGWDYSLSTAAPIWTFVYLAEGAIYNLHDVVLATAVL